MALAGLVLIKTGAVAPVAVGVGSTRLRALPIRTHFAVENADNVIGLEQCD